jgi:hypothetical protein
MGEMRNAYNMLVGKYEPVAGSCEHGNEPLGSINGRELFD